MEAAAFYLLQKFPGLLTILRRRFMGYQDAVMLILDNHHTVVCAQRVVAVNMTLRRRGEGQQVLQHRLWRGQMRANIIKPSFDRRLGNGNQEQGEKRDYSKDTGLLQAARASCKVWRVWWRPAPWASRHMSSAMRALICSCVRTL